MPRHTRFCNISRATRLHSIGVSRFPIDDVEETVRKVRDRGAPAIETLTEPQLPALDGIIGSDPKFSVQHQLSFSVRLDEHRSTPASPWFIFPSGLPEKITATHIQSDER